MLIGYNLYGFLKESLKREFEHFQKLNPKARRLILSYTFLGAAYPLVSTFINAYIWRTEGDLKSIAIYNLGNFLMLPLAFYINGILLRKIKINYMYFLGSLLIGTSAVLVVFFKSIETIYFLYYGIVYGIGNGFYWANRNFLTLKQTSSTERNYFIGLNFTLDTVTSIIVPAITGWLIILGSNLSLYTINSSYRVMIFFAFLLLFLSGFIILKDKYEVPKLDNIFKSKISGKWFAIRILTLAIGLAEGISFFLPTIIILYFLGHEEVLGSVDSLAAVIIATLSYFFGRLAKKHHQIPLLFISVLVSFFASLILYFSTGKIGIASYILLGYLSGTFIWLASDPFIMDIMDTVVKESETNEYTLIFDRELFLNIGRIIMCLLIPLAAYSFDQGLILKLTPLIATLAQISLIFIFWKLLKRV